MDALGSAARQIERSRLGRTTAFVAVAYAFGVTMLGTTLPTPLYPIYRAELGFSELTVTVIFGTYAVGVIAVLLLLGGLSDQIGRRRLLLPGLAFSALSAVAFLFAHGVAMLLVGRALSGLSAGIFTGTATAALADLAPPDAPGHASVVATVANMAGLGVGPLLAGLLAEFAGMSLRLAFWVDLALLVPAAVVVWAMPEPARTRGHVQARVRLPGVPPEVRAVFVRAALAGVAGFAVLGLFTAVAPGFLGQTLGIDSPAVVGAVVFAVFAASTVGQTALEPLFGAGALVAGSIGLVAGMGFLAAGLALSSLPFVVAGGVVSGLGQGLSFRHGLAAVSAASPAERRGEVASSFFVVAYLALSVPVVGVGLVAAWVGLLAAGLVFAATVAALAVGVIVLVIRRSGAGAERRERQRSRPVFNSC